MVTMARAHVLPSTITHVLAEGPTWDAETERARWVDIEEGRVDEAGIDGRSFVGERVAAQMSGTVGAAAQTRDEDLSFHSLLGAASGNAIMSLLVEPSNECLRESYRVPSAYAVKLQESIAEHQAILDAIRARDPEATRAATQRRLERIRQHPDDMFDRHDGAVVVVTAASVTLAVSFEGSVSDSTSFDSSPTPVLAGLASGQAA